MRLPSATSAAVAHGGRNLDVQRLDEAFWLA
jgi:hypothetical protein